MLRDPRVTPGRCCLSFPRSQSSLGGALGWRCLSCQGNLFSLSLSLSLSSCVVCVILYPCPSVTAPWDPVDFL